METEQIEFTETLNYVRHDYNGKEILCGMMVNIPGAFSADNLEQLKEIAVGVTDMWIHSFGYILKVKEPFNVKELTQEEWDAKDDNIDYWEMERILRILQRPTIKKEWMNVIAKAMIDTGSKDSCVAERIYNALAQQTLDNY